MQGLRRVGAGLLLLAAAGVNAADDQAQNLLREMHDATRHLNYDGIFVYQRGAQLDTMRLVHMVDGDVERERLISLSGPAREVIRDGTRVTCLFADDHAAMVERAPPRDIIGIGFSAPVDALVDNYHFSLDGRERIAARDAVIVGVTPLRDDRYGYQLWIDAASKLLLKSVILGRGGRALEQVQFTHIDVIDAPDPERLRPEIAGSGFTWQLDADDGNLGSGSDEALHWRVAWVPDGFEMKENDVQNMATSKMPVDHLVYSDGLAMVSVFIEALMEGEPPLQGYSARGAVNAFSRIADGHQITVVGEVPLPTVRQIAASVGRVP
ncbi:MAG: MucB/RseB C-terminal domain-containing protein [Gammaproteobacteria bacterium]|nr:MucB/RseB C-terminal domain-containing protein [Gammaproteobacteria bacterium]MCP5198383.1 MucB/RseB C-terminal domain-containing protein [Gammaproteobacteria bacterium]